MKVYTDNKVIDLSQVESVYIEGDKIKITYISGRIVEVPHKHINYDNIQIKETMSVITPKDKEYLRETREKYHWKAETHNFVIAYLREDVDKEYYRLNPLLYKWGEYLKSIEESNDNSRI